MHKGNDSRARRTNLTPLTPPPASGSRSCDLAGAAPWPRSQENPPRPLAATSALRNNLRVQLGLRSGSMGLKLLAATTALTIITAAGGAEAAVVFDITQVGSNVVIT